MSIALCSVVLKSLAPLTQLDLYFSALTIAFVWHTYFLLYYRSSLGDGTPQPCVRLYSAMNSQSPRYTIHIVDTETRAKNMTFAVFIAPQGKWVIVMLISVIYLLLAMMVNSDSLIILLAPFLLMCGKKTENKSFIVSMYFVVACLSIFIICTIAVSKI